MTSIDKRREAAYRAGMAARMASKPASENDQPAGTIFHDDWADGWHDQDNSYGHSHIKTG